LRIEGVRGYAIMHHGGGYRHTPIAVLPYTALFTFPSAYLSTNLRIKITRNGCATAI